MNTVSDRRGDHWSIVRTDLGDISGRTALYFTMKTGYDKTDAQATLQVDETNGLLVLNADDDVTATDASITVDDEVQGNITIVVKDSVTVDVEPALYVADVQMIDADGAQTLEEFYFAVPADVTRAIS